MIITQIINSTLKEITLITFLSVRTIKGLIITISLHYIVKNREFVLSFTQK